jgi:hypothetical protein
MLGLGRCQMDDTAMLYVVMEHADEDLSQIIPERALSGSEARAMLGPVLSALRYVHRQGYVHGRLKPSNIMAVGDQVKLSGDGLWRAGEIGERRAAPGRYDPPEMVTTGPSAAGDVWSLGVALTEILTQKLPIWTGPGQNELKLPDNLPEPFVEIARHCLQSDARARWNVDQIAVFLESGEVPAFRTSEPNTPPANSGSKRLIVLAAAAVLLIAILLLWNYTSSSSTPAVATAPATTPAQTAPAPPPAVAKAPETPREEAKRKREEKREAQKEAQKEEKREEAKTIAPTAPASREIAVQVMPKVTQHSLDAIHGRFAVVMRARANAQGDVTSAEFETRGPSKFFAEKSLAAVKQWHFAPADGSQEWTVRFDYGKGEVHPSATKSGK